MKKTFPWGKVFISIICLLSLPVILNFCSPAFRMEFRAALAKDNNSKQLFEAYSTSLAALNKLKTINREDYIIGMIIAVSFDDVDYAERFIDAIVNSTDKSYGNSKEIGGLIQKTAEDANVKSYYRWKNLRQIPQFEATRCDLVGSAIKNNNLKMVQMLLKKGMKIRDLNVLVNNFYKNEKTHTKMLKSLFTNADFINQLKSDLEVTLNILKTEEIRVLLKDSCPDEFLCSMAKAVENDPAAQFTVAQEFRRRAYSEAALSFYKKSAEHGNTEAQRKLGECYLTGELNCKKDLSSAIKYFQKAASKNDFVAQKKLETLPSQDCIVRANFGDSDSQYELAQWFFKNYDFTNALEWFYKAADNDNGSLAAMKFLGSEFLKQRGVFGFDEETGIKFLKKAIANKDAESMRILGNYFLRKNVFENGIDLLIEAQKLGDKNSQQRLNFLTDVPVNEKIKCENYYALMGGESSEYFNTKPVVDIFVEEGKEFCRRLTILSQKTNKITKNQEFRLIQKNPNDEIGEDGFSIILVNKNIPAGTNISAGTTSKHEKKQKSSTKKSDSRIIYDLCNSMVALENFQICKYEISQKTFEAITGRNPSRFKGNDLPVESISVKEAVEFCQKLTKLARALKIIGEQKEFRLPTTDEWETACRANEDFSPSYISKNNLEELAWFGNGYLSGTFPIGTKKPNNNGLYDMYGNVWEFCYDKNRKFFVRKGGGFFSQEDDCDASYSSPANKRSCDTGFRVILAPVE